MARLENRLTGLERLRDETGGKIERLRTELARAGGLLGRPFPHAERLAAARARVGQIGEELERVATRVADDKPALAEVGAAVGPELSERHDQRREWAGRAPAPAHPLPAPVVAGNSLGARMP